MTALKMMMQAFLGHNDIRAFKMRYITLLGTFSKLKFIFRLKKKGKVLKKSFNFQAFKPFFTVNIKSFFFGFNRQKKGFY